jgi:hypothetical protein
MGSITKRKTKWDYFETALWVRTGEFVHLDRYYPYSNSFEITTIQKQKVRVFKKELSNFVL